MVRKREVLPHLYCVTTLPCKLNTIANIGIKFFCFIDYTVLSVDSIKMMCGCSSQVAMLDVSVAILDNSFKTSTLFIDTVINETL